MSKLTDIREALTGRLALIREADDYSVTLSAGQVHAAKLDAPPGNVAPAACVWVVQVDESLQGAPLTARRQTGRWLIRVWGPYQAHSTAARVSAAEALVDDVRRALRGDPRLGRLVTTMAVSAAPLIEEQSATKQAYASALVSVVCEWTES